MDRILIKGGASLKGSVQAGGAKNSILPLLFSTLLCKGEHTFHNVSQVKDVWTATSILKKFGCEIEKNNSSLKIKVPSKLQSFQTPYDLMKTMRAGVLSLGPLLARYGQAQVSLPGGCAIGLRPVNFHIENLKKMGVSIEVKKGYIHGKSLSKKLKGSPLSLEKPSVGATQNLMMAATLSEGETQITNAAQEPEVVDLSRYLKKMGAQIQGAGTNKIIIHGVSELSPSSHTVISDRIEVATLLMAVAITKGNARITKCHPKYLTSVLENLKQSGFDIQTGEDWIELHSPSSFSSLSLSTSFYPGFPTDLQAQFMALMTQAHGESHIEESIFENRFMHVPELIRLNADIKIFNQTAVVKGPCSLKGAFVTATDLRASSCLVLAGLVAEGETCIHRVYHLDRGYEKLEQKLSKLGAHIQRI